MSLKRGVVVCLAMSGLLTFLPTTAGQDEVPPGLKGDWSAVAITRHGKPIIPGPIDRITMTIGKDELVLVENGKRSKAKYVVATGKSPAHIDMILKAGEKPFKGIYELKGDVFTICYSPDGERPEAFRSTEDEKTTLIEFRREKN